MDVNLTGWVTAITTAGLLGPVLYWICYVHLPAKDRQLQDLLAAQAKERDENRESRHEAGNRFLAGIADVVSLQRQESKEIRKEFKEALSVVLSHCEKETLKITEAFRTEIARLASSAGNKP